MAAVVLAAALAMPLAVPVAVGTTAAADSQNPELHQQMEQLDSAYKTLYRAMLRDPAPSKQGEYLGLVQTMQTSALSAKAMLPANVAALPADQQPAMTEAYRRAMLDSLATLLELERAILDKNYAQAKELLGQLNDQKRAGHEQFRVDG